MSDPLSRPIAELAASLRAGDVSAEEVTKAAIARHEALGPQLKAYKLFTPERALEEARAADAALASGERVPPLTGIPMSVKDLYGVDGLPTFAGTPRQLPAKWSRDSWLVARMREAGAITVGKTHMVEMAFGGVGTNPQWETPVNPWDADTPRIPGGSSSGAGVSLHEGSALIALGSDTGGSIRIPAALTGTVGQRTTKGRWPTDGVVQLAHTFDTVGALTRTVTDSIWFFGAVDPKWGDPAVLSEELRGTELSGLRIGIASCDVFRDCQGDIADVVHATLEELQAAGARLVEVDASLVDDGFELALGGRAIASTECKHFLETELPGWLDLLNPLIGERLKGAGSPTDDAYRDAMAEHRRLAEAANGLFERVDVLALPANLITPPPIAEVDDPARMERYGEVNKAILRPTYPISILGLTGISVPVGLDGAGMPVGLQLVAPGMRDEVALGAAWAVEREIGTAVERLGGAGMVR